MVLLDSNIVIYLLDPQHSAYLVGQLQNERLCTSNVIIAEVLGYAGLLSKDGRYFEELFASMTNLAFNDDVTNKVIEIRKTTNLQLPDAIIAATAMVHGAVLWTHNTEDFEKVAGLTLFDPLA